MAARRGFDTRHLHQKPNRRTKNLNIFFIFLYIKYKEKNWNFFNSRKGGKMASLTAAEINAIKARIKSEA